MYEVFQVGGKWFFGPEGISLSFSLYFPVQIDSRWISSRGARERADWLNEVRKNDKVS